MVAQTCCAVMRISRQSLSQADCHTFQHPFIGLDVAAAIFIRLLIRVAGRGRLHFATPLPPLPHALFNYIFDDAYTYTDVCSAICPPVRTVPAAKALDKDTGPALATIEKQGLAAHHALALKINSVLVAALSTSASSTQCLFLDRRTCAPPLKCGACVLAFCERA